MSCSPMVRTAVEVADNRDPNGLSLGLRALAESQSSGEILESLRRHVSISENHLSLGREGRETATHYVWLLGTSETQQVSVYLHEYKDPISISPGYATTVHNHRYNFSSLILRGGYRESRYLVARGDDGASSVKSSELLTTRVYRSGSVLSIGHEEFHAVRDILPATLTLVVKSQPFKAYSNSFHEELGIWRIHVPVENRVPELLDALNNDLTATNAST